MALIDIGGGTTDLAIAKDGIIRHTAVIPLVETLLLKTLKRVVLSLENRQTS